MEEDKAVVVERVGGGIYELKEKRKEDSLFR